MESIKINQSNETYFINSIRTISENILEIVFNDVVPEEYGNISVFTTGGRQCSYLPGFSTVYKTDEEDNHRVLLSNDNSVYVEPEPIPDPEPSEPIEPYVPTLEEVKISKKNEISSTCEEVIYNGIDVVLTDGNTYHFSLTEKDQLNLFGNQVQIASGAETIEYHADGQPCIFYSAIDMENIVKSAMAFVKYHTTYCNSINNMWLPACETIDEVNAIYYGINIPEEYQSDVLKSYLLIESNSTQATETNENTEV